MTTWAIPQGKEKCRKCKALVKFRHSHESKCRGSALLNRTCRKCGKEFPEPPEGELSRPLGNHEIRCRGQTVDNANQAVNTAETNGGKGRGKGSRTGRSRAPGRAKAKAKAKTRAEAKAKPKAEAKAKVRVTSLRRLQGRQAPSSRTS